MELQQSSKAVAFLRYPHPATSHLITSQQDLVPHHASPFQLPQFPANAQTALPYAQAAPATSDGVGEQVKKGTLTEHTLPVALSYRGKPTSSTPVHPNWAACHRKKATSQVGRSEAT